MGRIAAKLFSGISGPLKDIQRLVLKPLPPCLGCLLRVVVLVEDEPSPQSEVLSALEQIFIKDLYFAPFLLISILTRLPLPAVEKHPDRMILPPQAIT
jgi:hypothetical protein